MNDKDLKIVEDTSKDEVFLEESEHLKTVTNQLKDSLSVLEKSFEVLGEDNLLRLKELRDNFEGGIDLLLFLEQLTEKNEAFNIKDKYQRVEEFKFLLSQPFFARIDLSKSNNEDSLTPNPVNETYYIGKFGYTLDKPIVLDWRTKVASLYYRYRYPQKNVNYDTPQGKEVADLLLKRTFEIDNGELIKYFNNDIQLDENSVIIEKIESRTGGVLEDIVETIQQSQMDIIETDPRKVCIVQGCVGSGKSTVAIHKMAHIFFNHSNLIHPQKSILVAKNQILVGYLSTLFPKLGIFDINYKTLRELMIHIIFREELNIKIDLDIETETKDFDLEKINKLTNNINKIHEGIKHKFENISQNTSYESFSGFVYSVNQTPFENISDYVSELEEEIFIQKEIVKEEGKDSIRGMVARDNISNLRKLIRELNQIKSDLKDKSFKEVLKSQDINSNEKLSYLKTLTYLYVYSKLIGIKNFPKYEYCVVDEGQDFSLIEYALLGQLVIRGRFAIFGDLNQSVESDGIKEWEEIPQVISDAKSASKFELNTNYRSTKPIIELARSILEPYTSKYLPNSINRKGPEPIILDSTNSKKSIVDIFNEQFSEDISSLNKSIGIICYSNEVMTDIEKYLDGIISTNQDMNNHIIKLDSKTSLRYIPKGIYLTSREDCKGLEFSKVYVLGLDINKIKSYEEARKAFVCITRAMNELVIIN